MNYITIETYTTSAGNKPFNKWQDKLDANIRAIIRTRLDRVKLGNFGDCSIIKSGDGVWELRIDVGPGFRIYFGKIGSTVIVLLIGGAKGSQIRDIEKAKRYWNECKG
jgi:putative addiction module killer protein